MNRGRRPYWRSIRTYWYWFAIVALLVVPVVHVPARPGPAAAPTGREVLTEGVHRVRRVVDGDTLLMQSGARVRLEGVDTPETVRENYPVEPWGPEASAFTKDFIKQSGRQRAGSRSATNGSTTTAATWRSSGTATKCSTKSWSAPAWPRPGSAGTSAPP